MPYKRPHVYIYKLTQADIYIYMYIYRCIYIYMYMHMYIHICVHIDIYMYAYMYKYMGPTVWNDLHGLTAHPGELACSLLVDLFYSDVT